ncbi:MAG: YggS family pyridoxal phosphate-dependent enzyme [Lentihominibacter sp.]
MEDIRANLEKINGQIKAAAEGCGRSADDVLLVAVSKTRTPEEINIAIDAGVTDIGENKVQEIMDKYDAVKPVKWHMIGHLQTNKVKYIIDKVSMIHSVDSYKLAVEIDKRAKSHGITMDILLQVNSAQEESKFGITTDETEKLINDILENCENIRIRGLMCIAPFAEDPEEIKVYFEEVKKQYDQFGRIEHERLDFRYLSMGMSHDFTVAIEAGSNLVRVGSAIFGERNYNK